MLTKQDINILKGMFAEQTKHFDLKLDSKLGDLKREMQDFTRSCIAASEARMIARMDAGLEAMHRKIVDEITDFIANSIVPQLDAHDLEIKKIKLHFKLA